jgi:hypothetical protein
LWLTKRADGRPEDPRASSTDESSSIRAGGTAALPGPKTDLARREPGGERSDARHRVSLLLRVASLSGAYEQLAQWLLAHEMKERPQARTAVEAAERVAVELSSGASSLVSPDGYRALLKRALYLASAESKDLGGTRIGISDTYLEGLAGEASDHALVALFAHVIALLATFIGDELTGNLIRQRWPHAPIAARGLRLEEERA